MNTTMPNHCVEQQAVEDGHAPAAKAESRTERLEGRATELQGQRVGPSTASPSSIGAADCAVTIEDVAEVLYPDHDVVVDSPDVAHLFEKPHEDVLRAVRGAQCTREFREVNFLEREVDRPTHHVAMTVIGVMFATMRFTDERSARVRELFLEAYSAMRPEFFDERVIPCDDDLVYD